MAKKTISIAMGTYNGARNIMEQLESFARQTVRPDELIVTDDGSTDNTLELVTQFAATSPFPVRVEKNAENLGFRRNFMKAAGLCRSDVIAFSDQDDVWLPHKLENVIAPFDMDDTLLVYHNATVVTHDLKPLSALDDRAAPQRVNLPQTMNPFHFGLGFTLTFRRVLLSLDEFWPQSRDFYFFDKVEAHDQWFFFLASCLGTVHYIPEHQVLYRQHQGNVCGWEGDQSGWVNKLKNLLDSDAIGLLTRERACAARASIMEQAKDRLDDHYHARAASAAAGYRSLEKTYRLRHQMYGTGNVFKRSAQFLSLLKQNSYRPQNQWGAGSKAMLRDLVCGVVPLEAWQKIKKV